MLSEKKQTDGQTGVTMLSSFLASTYNYQHSDSNYFPPTLNIPQFAYARHPALIPASSSSTTTSTTSSTTTATADSNLVVKQESDDEPSPAPDTSSTIKFSIDNILGLKSDSQRQFVRKDEVEVEGSQTTTTCDGTNDDNSGNGDDDNPRFPWLQCTRYKPPKLPRLKRKDGVKRRKLGRNPRVPFTQHQVAVLEEKFRRTHYLSSMDVAELSTALSLSDNRVKIWFQNRRARERRDREAAQTSTLFPPKSSQPLMVPTVSWPVSPHSSNTAFAQLRTAIQQSRSGFLPSAFSLYLPRPQTQDHNKCSVDTADERT